MANLLLTSASVTILLFIAQHVFTDSSREPRILTPEEQALADDARAEVAKVLEKNLIKFFTLVAADNGRELFSRQEDDEEDVTLNPTVLPQVAQILSAIFHGGLNISKVIDRTFTLAPVALRGQVEGLFKLLTGNDITTTTTSTTPKPKQRVRTTTTTTTESTAPPTTPTASHNIQKYKLRNRNRTTTEAPSVDDFYSDDDELFRLEEEVISAAIDAEPYTRDKQPRFFRGAVREILDNFDKGRLNLTQVVRFLPDLFQGARRAMTLLENLGQLAGADEDDY